MTEGTEHGLWLRRQEIPFVGDGYAETDQHARARRQAGLYRQVDQLPRACYADCRLGQTVFAARGRHRPAAGVTAQERTWVTVVIVTAVVLIVALGSWL